MNRRDKQKAETFVEIMRSAEELFMRKGYEKTSMQEIADHSGLTKGALYHHFASKEDLLERMCADHSRVLTDAARPVVEDSSLSCFARIRKVLDLSRGMGMSTVSFVSEYLKVRHDEGSLMLREKLLKYEREFYASVVGPLLAEAKEKGECGFAASSSVLAVFLHQLDRSVSEEIRLIFAEHSRAEAEKRIVEVMKTYVYAISRMLNAQPEAVSELISLEESMHFYSEVLNKIKK